MTAETSNAREWVPLRYFAYDGGSAPTNYEQVAHMAVMQADALLEELAKGDRNVR